MANGLFETAKSISEISGVIENLWSLVFRLSKRDSPEMMHFVIVALLGCYLKGGDECSKINTCQAFLLVSYLQCEGKGDHISYCFAVGIRININDPKILEMIENLPAVYYCEEGQDKLD
jgi:hypothetical protein